MSGAEVKKDEAYILMFLEAPGDTDVSRCCGKSAGLEEVGRWALRSLQSLGRLSRRPSGYARCLEKWHQGPVNHPTHPSREVLSLPRKMSGLDRFGKSLACGFVQCKVRRAFWERGHI